MHKVDYDKIRAELENSYKDEDLREIENLECLRHLMNTLIPKL